MSFAANLYTVLHLVGLFTALAGLGGMIMLRMNPDGSRGRALCGIAHGVGMLLALVGGFGLVARLGHGFQPWVIAKIVIWLLVGASPALIRRKPEAGPVWFGLILTLVTVAAVLGRFQPWGA